MRRLGRVTVCASDLAAVPYAARARGRAFVVVPSDRLTDLPALRVLVAHELQHHRHRDLHVVRALEALRACFPWHPIVSTWARLVAELQEMACDAAVLQRGRVDRRAYVELLVSAAAASPSLRFVPRGVTAASGGSAAALRRRIDMMMNRRASRSSLARDLVLAAAGLAVVVSSAVAVRGAVVEPSLGSPDVAALSRKLAARGVTVPVNDVVLEEVDKWTSDAKNRAFLRESRRRLDVHRAMVETTLARHHVPSALAAVAVVESGFRRLEPKAGIQGAGVWQFIPATARRYGLEVKDGRDDRMDLDRETDAAARYLGAMNLEFQDWTLAVAGYSEGESAVARAAEAGNTRDAWELMRQGRISRYAATVLAAALVLEDPDRLLVD